MQILKKINLKKVLTVILILAPIIFEFIFFSNYKLSINKQSITRLLVEYGIIALYGIFCLLNKHSDKVKIAIDFLFKYRWLIGLGVFLIMVIFNLNMSSIGMWANIIPSDNNQGTTIIGEARAIRGDEWSVQTPFFLAQAMSDKFYPLVNENVRYNGQNMLMVYPAPVFDITLISKPMNLGFILLGRDRGLSWYFSMIVVLLVLLSIEFLNIVTKKDKLLSIAGGFMLAFSPAIMWWFNSTSQIYLYALAIMVAFYYYMNNLDYPIWKKLLLAFGLVVSVTGFVFCFYPALQIPIIYMVLAFCLIVFIKNIKKVKKKDWIIIAVTILLMLAILGYYLYVSFDSIKQEMSTKYPGKRVDLGGNVKLKVLTNYLFTLFTPFNESGNILDYGNESERSGFIYPLFGLIIVLICLTRGNIKEKIKEHPFLTALISIFIFEFTYSFLGFNNLFAKISMLSMSTSARILLAVDFIGSIIVLIILKICSDRKEKLFNNFQAIVISIIAPIILYLILKQAGYIDYFGQFKLLIVFLFVGTMTYLFITFNKKGFSYFMFVTTIITGLSINPITYSTGAIYNTDTSAKIQEIANEDKGALWCGNRKYEAQYILANGGRVLNGVNYYPNYDWLKIIDPEGKYEDVYNRYAHIDIKLGEKTEFNLLSEDSYEITLSPESFGKLDIDYFLSNEEISSENKEKYSLELIFYNQKEGERIYKVKT